MNFSDELNKYINLLNCSAKDICEISGLSPTIVSRYLNGKRTPRIESEYFLKIVNSIYEISLKKNINLNKDDIIKTLTTSIDTSNINYDDFITNFNILFIELKINNSEFAKALGYDTSFISKIRNKSRKPSDLDNFISNVSNYISTNYVSTEKKKIVATILQCSENSLNNSNNYKILVTNWLTYSRDDQNKQIENFLTALDTFDLNNYVGTDFSKIKIPSAPVILKSNKTFYGKAGRKQSEAEFLKTTLLSKSKEPIFFYNNLPMEEASQDEDFKKKWVLAITMILKKGLHLNIVHDIDRPINEMLVGLESWIPIYMTGSISPYYFKKAPSNFFSESLCTSGVVALSSECISNNEDKSRFYLTTKKEELDFYKEKSKYMLSKAKPLMEIYKESDKNEFKEFMKTQRNDKIKTVKKDAFKNIDFYINKNKWITINKKISPEIHFVIYNDKLRNAIETFLMY